MHAMFLSEQFKNRMAKAFICISAVASLFMLVSNSLRGFPISDFISLYWYSGGAGKYLYWEKDETKVSRESGGIQIIVEYKSKDQGEAPWK